MNFITGWSLQMDMEGHADKARAWLEATKPVQFKQAVDYLAVPFTDALYSLLSSYKRHVSESEPSEQA